MNPTMTYYNLDIPLSIVAHLKAEEFCSYQADSHRAKQVYLNTLAVYAVNIYLKSLGFQTDLEKSSSWNPVNQTLMNTADLIVKDCGKIECRPVLPDADSLYIPEEVWTQRVGYIAVKLDDSLQQATLLGFIDRVSATNLSLNALYAITELPEYLNSLARHKQVQAVPRNQEIAANLATVRLSQWLENVFEAGWQRIDELYPTSLAFNFRNSSQLANAQNQDLSGEISRVKLLELVSSQETKQIGLMVRILAKIDDEMDISVSVKVYPADRQSFLPQGLQVIVLDELEIPVMQAQAKQTETVEFKFSGELGEYFCVKVIWEESSKTEAFII
jgi:hypothetical protein